MTGPRTSWWSSAFGTGTRTVEWCTECLAETLVTAEVYELSEAGVRWVTTFQHCPRCVALKHLTDPD